MKITKLCAYCRKEFEKLSNCSVHNWNNRKKYCSKKCFYSAPRSIEWRTKLESARKRTCEARGYYVTDEGRRRQIESHIGVTTWNVGLTKETDERVRKMSEHIAENGIFFFKPGSAHPNWKDGSSVISYSKGWTNRLREQIRSRDNYKCQLCYMSQSDYRTKKGKKHKLLVHHIDYNKKNCNTENMISLCPDCHAKTNFNREYWQNFFKFYYLRNLEYEIELSDEVLIRPMSIG